MVHSWKIGDLMDYRYAGALLNSAIYLVGCFIAGLYTAHPWSWKLALAAMGVTYLSYIVQISTHRLANAVTLVSIVIGLASGISLLV